MAIDIDDALDAILNGYARKVVKITLEMAARRNFTPSFDQVERLSKTLERTKRQIRVVFEQTDKF